MFLWTFHTLFLGYFFIGKSVFDAVFCHYRVFNSTDFDSKTNLGWFSYQTFEFRKCVTVPTFNETTGNAKYYADCFQGIVAGTYAKIAELSCESNQGSLVSLTSQEKENFIYSKNNIKFINYGLLIENLQHFFDPNRTSHFHIGLTSTNGNLNWYNYNQTQIPVKLYSGP